MIKKVKLNNIQSHEKSILDFHEGVNIIVGSSDKGKSAILRGLNWTVNNRPLGDELRSFWGGDTICSIELADGSKVVRKKTDRGNYYYLDSDRFKAFKANIPEEIVEALNFSDLNFQYQIDPPFMLTKSPVEISRYLNRVIDLEIIDKSLSKINQIHLRENRELKSIRDQITQQEEDFDNYKWISDAQADLRHLESLSEDLDGYRQDIDSLEEIKAQYEALRESQEVHQEIVKHDDQVTKLIDDQEDLEALQRRIRDLKKIESSLLDLNLDIEDRQDFLELESVVTDLIKDSRERDKISEQLTDMEDLRSSLEDITNSKILLEKELERLETEFKEIAPEVCPLCGNEWRE